jgi:MHS family proline/betaine transporter-like MFS transporter
MNKSFFGAAIGTLIEYYDYSIFALFLPLIAPLFFPANSAYQSLIKGYYVLLIALLARPLGGLLFGYLGDMLGRRKALLSSIYGIAIATFIMGLVPSHAIIGAWAAIIITIAKSVQLFCFGGEYNGAGIYVVEHADPKNAGFIGSLLTATTLAGSLLATSIGILATAHFAPAWSWRIVFIFGGCIGLFGIFYRKNLLESPHFQQADVKLHGLSRLFKKYPRELFAGFFIGGFATVPFTTVLFFINPVLTTKGYFSSHELMIAQTLLIIIAIITLITAGRMADKYSPKKVMQLGAIFLMLFSYPLLRLVDHGTLFVILFAEIIFIIINEILLGPSNAYLKSIFATQYRYRGSSLSFCLGMSLLGGLTPIIENYLYQWKHQFSTTSIWLIFVGLGTFLSLTWVRQSSASPPKIRNINPPYTI